MKISLNINNNIPAFGCDNEIKNQVAAVDILSQRPDTVEIPPKKQKNAGAVKGYLADKLVSVVTFPLTVWMLIAQGKASKNLSAEQLVAVKDAAGNAIRSSGLEAVGAKLVNAGAAENSLFAKITASNFDPKMCVPKSLQKFVEPVMNLYDDATRLLEVPKNNTVVLTDKQALSVFQDMGHLMNKNFSKIGKALQKIRFALPITASIPLFVALLKPKKVATEDKPLSAWDKTTNFIRSHAGSLTVLAMAPITIEKIMATVKGNKLAKAVLSPELYKSVAKSNALGCAIYALTALAGGVSTYFGVKVKDAAQAKQDAKQV